MRAHAISALAGLLWCVGGLAPASADDGLPSVDFRAEPVTVPFEAIDLHVGEGYTCALALDGVARCWGRGYGPLPGRVIGRGVALRPQDPWVVSVAPPDAPEHDADGWRLRFDTVTDFGMGGEIACARDREGRARCRQNGHWFESLEAGTGVCWRAEGAPPCPQGRPLLGLLDVAVAPGRRGPCKAPPGALREVWHIDDHIRGIHYLDRTGRIGLHCTVIWGTTRPPKGQRILRPKTPVERDPEFPPLYTAVQHRTRLLPEKGRARAIAGAQDVLCAARDGGTVDCWGETLDDLDPYGPRMKMRPTRGGQRALPARVALDASGGLEASRSHVCGLGADRRIRCFGWNSHGQLGAPPPLGVVLLAVQRLAEMPWPEDARPDLGLLRVYAAVGLARLAVRAAYDGMAGADDR